MKSIREQLGDVALRAYMSTVHGKQRASEKNFSEETIDTGYAIRLYVHMQRRELNTNDSKDRERTHDTSVRAACK